MARYFHWRHGLPKRWADMKEPKTRAAAGRLAGGVGLVCNGVLCAGKLTAGLLAGSVSMTADAVNNLTDMLSSLITILGFRMARRPADADHPYGHGRYEYLAGLAISVLILVLGAGMLQTSVKQIIRPEEVQFTALSYAVMLVSVGIKGWLYLFTDRLGRRIGSPALSAAAADSRNDVFATTAVLLGAGIGQIFHIQADGYMGLAVALFILYSGWQMAGEAISPLLGRRADNGLVRDIRSLTLSHTQILGLHDLMIHDYGPGQRFASLHVEMDATADAWVCHNVIDEIEKEVLEQLHVHLVIHCDPVKRNP